MGRHRDRATRLFIPAAALLLAALPVLHAAAAAPGARGMTADGAADSLQLSLETPDTVASGEPVPVRFLVENVSGRTLTLYLLGRTIAFDVVVRDAGGEAVWRRMAGEVVPQILRAEILEAGDSLLLEGTWDQRSNDGAPVGAGTYVMVAELFTDGEPLRSPAATVRIVKR